MHTPPFLLVICLMLSMQSPLFSMTEAKDAKKINKDFYLAVENSNLEKAQELFGLGADINFVLDTLSGFTPLHVAVSNGGVAMAEFLLAKNAQVNAKTKRGSTPLHIAIRFGLQNLEQVQKEYSPDPDNKPDQKNQTISVKFPANYSTIIKLLLKKGAMNFLADNNKLTAGELLLLQHKEDGDNDDAVDLFTDELATLILPKDSHPDNQTTTVDYLASLFQNIIIGGITSGVKGVKDQFTLMGF